MKESKGQLFFVLVVTVLFLFGVWVDHMAEDRLLSFFFFFLGGLGMTSNTFYLWTHRKTSLHLYTSMHVIKDFCRPEQPDAHDSLLAFIVLISAVGRSIHCRTRCGHSACERKPYFVSLVSTASINGCYSHRQEQLRNSISES